MTEKIAELIHEVWVSWAKQLIIEEEISHERKKRWESCFVPYDQLSEEMKEIDRKIARQLQELK